jgi:hypothetical protein
LSADFLGFMNLAQEQLICPGPLYWPRSADLPLLAYMAQDLLICFGLLTWRKIS